MVMINKRIVSSIFAIILIIVLSSCNSQSVDNRAKESETDIFAMDTYMSLKAYGENSEKVLQKTSDKIKDLDEMLSVINEKSEIFKLNNANGEQIKISSDTALLINRSIEINKDTNGAFDITLYPITKEWGFTTGNYKVPTQARIDELLKYVGSENIILDNDNNSVSLNNHANIDLGGIAKGYAGRCAADIIKSEGITSAILNMGGNVQTIGAKPDGNNWKIGIQDPNDSSDIVGIVEVADKAVITSGGYERYFEDENGNIYRHIIDPKTGYPAETDIISVTVIGSDGMTCDALSTSLFVMGIEKSVEYIGTKHDYDVIIVSSDNKIYITSGIAEKFTVSSKFSEYTLNTI